MHHIYVNVRSSKNNLLVILYISHSLKCKSHVIIVHFIKVNVQSYYATTSNMKSHALFINYQNSKLSRTPDIASTDYF